MSVNALQKLGVRDHGPEYKRPFPSHARGFFPRGQIEGLGYATGMAIYPDDPVRALVESRARDLGLDLSKLSRAIGANGSYLQQFLRRGTPRALPEDKRELLAPLLGVAPDDLRGASPGKGAPKPAETDAIAINADEANWLRMFRQLPPEKRTLAVGLVKVLSS